MVVREGELASDVTGHQQYPDTPTAMIPILSHLALKLSTRMALQPQQGASHRGSVQVRAGEQQHIGADQRSIIHTYHVDNVLEL